MSKHRDLVQEKKIIKRVAIAVVFVASLGLIGVICSAVSSNTTDSSSPRFSFPTEEPQDTGNRLGRFPRPVIPSIGAENAWEESDGPIYPSAPRPTTAPKPPRSTTVTEKPILDIPLDMPVPIEVTPEPEIIPESVEPKIVTPREEEPPQPPECESPEVFDDLLGICITPPTNVPFTE